MNLYECIEKSKNDDKEALLHLIEKFKPLIDKYNNKFFSDDIESELVIAIIRCTSKIKLLNFDRNITGALVNYYSLAIKNAYIDIVKKSVKFSTHVSLFEDTFLEAIEDENIMDKVNSKMQFEELLENLTTLQKEVIMDIFYFEKTEVEIAKNKDITKQAVCNLKMRALKKLRESYI